MERDSRRMRSRLKQRVAISFSRFFIKYDTCRTIITLATRKAGIRVGLANDYTLARGGCGGCELKWEGCSGQTATLAQA